MFSIRFARGAAGDLEMLNAHIRARIVQAIAERLRSQPTMPSRHRKELVGLVPPWEQVRPVWELRVGDHRVFYDVDVPERAVVIRAIRHKGRRTTAEIL
jgi:mRNA-degrading endonuclease RelE of RelBE toxin-antitoxin system